LIDVVGCGKSGNRGSVSLFISGKNPTLEGSHAACEGDTLRKGTVTMAGQLKQMRRQPDVSNISLVGCHLREHVGDITRWPRFGHIRFVQLGGAPFRMRDYTHVDLKPGFTAVSGIRLLPGERYLANETTERSLRLCLCKEGWARFPALRAVDPLHVLPFFPNEVIIRRLIKIIPPESLIIFGQELPICDLASQSQRLRKS
jgi:hypothetical protein